MSSPGPASRDPLFPVSRNTALIALAVTLLVALLAAPSVNSLLPSTESRFIEDYQPLKTLKFFKERGRAYHKYGPMTNFVLVPGYAVALGWWYANDEFVAPSAEYPYGFQRPVEQLSHLIFQGRIVFLVLGLICMFWFLCQLVLITNRTTVFALCALLTVGSSPYMAQLIPVTRPDSLLLSMSLLCLGLYLRLMYSGVTRRRLVLMGAIVMCAITAKEIAGSIFLLPVLGVGWLCIQAVRSGKTSAASMFKSILLAVLAAVVVYAALNVIYAPDIWLDRMRFWITGWNPTGIWSDTQSANPQSRFDIAMIVFSDFPSHLGIGGSLLVTAGLASLLVFRPPRWLLLLLPLVSYVCLALIPVGFFPAAQYFIVLAALVLPPTLAGISEALSRLKDGTQSLVVVATLVLVALDLLFATVAWHRHDSTYMRLVDNYLNESANKQIRFSVLHMWPEDIGYTWPGRLGYNYDTRPIGQFLEATDQSDFPEVFLGQTGLEKWIDDARTNRGRANMIKSEAGLDVEKWQGIAALGYTLEGRVEPASPDWFPFDFLRRPVTDRENYTLLIYKRTSASQQ